MQSGSAALPGLAPSRTARVAKGAGRFLGRLDLLTARIPPWAVLGPCIVVSWLVVWFVGSRAVHTGPVYYNGGDETWYWTLAWTLGHFHLPYAWIGYGYPLLLAPLAMVAGPSMIAGLPYAFVLNVAILGPIALLCVYGLAKLMGGRRFAYVAAILWVLAPLLAIPYFDPRYHRRYVGLTLPPVLGLTTLGDFPSMVALLVCGYFGFRAILTGRNTDALTSGLAAGLALAVKPSNGTFLPALVIALLVARRPRALLVTLAGLVPTLVVLVAWKARGLGYIPLIGGPTRAYALGAGQVPVGLSVHLGHYFPFSWHKLTQNIDGLREFTWSRRMVEWTLVAGAIGIFRRSRGGAVLLILWLATFVVLKGGWVATFNGGNFFRYLSPAFPAAFLLALSVPFLIPIAGRRLAAAGDVNVWPVTQRSRRWVLGVVAFLAAAPLVPMLAFPLQTAPNAANFPAESIYVPANQFPLTATAHGHAVVVGWPSQASFGARVVYEVFRAPVDTLSCTRPNGGATICSFPVVNAVEVAPVKTTKLRRYVDHPGPGTWIYRVLAASGSPPPIGISDAVLVSKPATAVVR